MTQATNRQTDNFMDWLLACDVADPYLQRQGRLAAAFLLGSFVLGIVLILALPIPAAVTQGGGGASGLYVGRVLVVVVLFGLYLLNRRGFTELAGMLYAGLLLFIAANAVRLVGADTPIVMLLLLPVITAGVFGPWWGAVVFGVLTFGVFYVTSAIATDYLAQLNSDPVVARVFLLVTLSLAVTTIAMTLYTRAVRRLVRENVLDRQRLEREQVQVARRLDVQTRQLRSSVEVARAISGERNLTILMNKIVQAIRETFGYYHVQIFLIDPEGEYAVLRESTGDVGQALLARGHRLAVGSLSVIGQVTTTGRPVVARDTDRDAVHRRNELLPRTRSELAVPLTTDAGTVIGALDLQSVEPDAFLDEDIKTLQDLADQIATAIENARAFATAQESLRELRELSQETTRQNWLDFLSEARITERRATYGPEPDTLQAERNVIIQRVQAAGMPVVEGGGDGKLPYIAVPIVVRDQVVGVIGVEPDRPRDWTRDDLTLMQGIAERTALAVENARLYTQAQRAVERERLINEIAARLQRAPNLRLLLEAATQELADALGTDAVYAEINLDEPLSTPDLEPGAEIQGDPEIEAPDEEARAEL